MRYAVAACWILSAGASVFAEQKPGGLLLTGGRVLDSNGERFLDGHELLIVGSEIAEVSGAAGEHLPAGGQRLDLDGLWIVPGLIDLHTHLLLHPYDETTWNDQVLKESLELRTVRAVAAARATVEAGFTTIRDLGTEGAGFADVALRDAIEQGIIPGPRVVAVTRALVATGCYGPMGFDPRWDVPRGAQVADGVAGVRRAVRQQIAAGADWIKVYADYRRQPGGPTTPTYSQDELNAIVDEARSAALAVAAHATIPEAIRRCVLAGVKTIEHGSDASDEVLALMRERSVALCPTLAASEAMARYSGWRPGMPDHERIVRAKAMFARALRSQVVIGCGSDAGVFAHGDSAREIELMVEYGMSPRAALQAATFVAADILGQGDALGRLAKGMKADVIAVSGDPLKGPAALRDPVLVIKNGKIIVDPR